MSLNNAQSNPWFFLIDFFLVLISCIALSVRPALGWLPLLVAFLPLAIRLSWKRSLIKSTRLNFLILLILITSFVGLLVSYNRDQAVHKFFLIICSILLFFSLTYQTKENLWIIAASLGIFGVITTIIFALTNNWASFPADFQFIKDFGDLLIKLNPKVRYEPFLNVHMFHANIVAGINAILFPLSAVTTFHFWKFRKFFLFVISLSTFTFLSLGLIITSSRAAWVATLLGLVILASLNNSNIRDFLTTHKFIFLLFPVLIITFGVFSPFLLADNIYSSTLSNSEMTSFGNRLQLAWQTNFLIADFPYTGGGLGSFPGLYSQYILVIPFFMFGNSHNLYLDLALEQGMFGFIIWISIIIFSAIALQKNIVKNHKSGETILFASAILSGLIILLLHGIVDDPIYSNSWGIALLFLFPGLSIALSEEKTPVFPTAKNFVTTSLVILAFLTMTFFVYKKQIQATWYANIGAVNMAKTELADWPTGKWNERRDDSVYDQAESNFRKSLTFQEENLTSNYRLGLVLMMRHDFQQAVQYLETALATNPEHRGIQKNIGYCYTWLGKFPEAELILKQIPGAQAEMEIYIRWWQAQELNGLANNASQMLHLLGN